MLVYYRYLIYENIINSKFEYFKFRVQIWTKCNGKASNKFCLYLNFEIHAEFIQY